MTTYKAGDLVTFKLDKEDEEMLNNDRFGYCALNKTQIIKHEPAPEPVDEVEEWLKTYTFAFDKKWIPSDVKAFSDAIIAKVKRELGK